MSTRTLCTAHTFEAANAARGAAHALGYDARCELNHDDDGPLWRVTVPAEPKAFAVVYVAEAPALAA